MLHLVSLPLGLYSRVPAIPGAGRAPAQWPDEYATLATAIRAGKAHGISGQTNRDRGGCRIPAGGTRHCSCLPDYNSRRPGQEGLSNPPRVAPRVKSTHERLVPVARPLASSPSASERDVRDSAGRLE